MGNEITMIENELAGIEATLITGLQMCDRLKKKLGVAASTPGSRKGLNGKDRSALIIKRRKHLIRKA